MSQASGARASHQSQNRQVSPPTAAQSASSGDGGSTKCRWSKNRGGKRSGKAPAQSQQGARVQGVSHKRPLDILSQVWDSQLGIAQKGLFPVGSRLSLFPASLATDNLRPVSPRGDQTGVFPPFCESPPIATFSCGDSVVQIAVQMTGAVGRGFHPS